MTSPADDDVGVVLDEILELDDARDVEEGIEEEDEIAELELEDIIEDEVVAGAIEEELEDSTEDDVIDDEIDEDEDDMTEDEVEFDGTAGSFTALGAAAFNPNADFALLKVRRKILSALTRATASKTISRTWGTRKGEYIVLSDRAHSHD